MPLIIDIQGFKIGKDKFITKELAAYDGNKVTHYVFKPPFRINSLSPEFHQQATWLMKNHHCINWEDGFTPLHKCADIIRQITTPFDVVYVKGREKAEYLRQFTTVPIMELAETPCIQKSKPSCFYHMNNYCICALTNVYDLHNYFLML